MRIFPLPHAWTRVLACLIFTICSGLFLAGCGCDAPPEDPMAELRAAFPEGRPEPAGVKERMADPAYKEKISEGATLFMAKSAVVAQAREAAEARAKAIADGLKAANPEADVAPETLEAALAADAGYQALLESLKQAEAEAEQVRQANMALIREKSTARQREYDALRAKLEAEAKPAQK